MNEPDTSFVGPNVTAARRFTRHLVDLLGKERGDMVTFLFAVAEGDGRRLWAELGYASLFEYLHRELGLSRSAAYFRAAAAGLVLQYPEVADALAEGRLCLSTVGELGKVITPENVRTVLPRFFHLSAREAREVVAELSPRPAPPTREVVMALPCRREHRSEPAMLAADPLRTVPTSGRGLDATGAVRTVLTSGRSLDATDPARPVPTSGHGSDATWPVASPDPATPHVETSDEPRLPPARVEERTATPAIRRDEIEPLTAELRRYHVTVSKRWVEKLNAAKAALSHSIPSGDGEEVLEAALDALLEREAKRKGLVKNPRKPADAKRPASPPETASVSAAEALASDRRDAADEVTSGTPVHGAATTAAGPRKLHRQAVPAHVRREVLIRDRGCCQAKLHDGTICGSKVRLQFDHVQPAVLGGPSTVSNIRVVCAKHNLLAARKIFGDAWMDAASP